jgi:hypothetical protein
MSPIVSDGTYKDFTMAHLAQNEQWYKDWIAAKGSLAHALHDELKERVDLSSFGTHLWTFEELVSNALGDHELSEAVIWLAAAIMNMGNHNQRHYYVTNEGRIDYHDERTEPPAATVREEQDSIIAGMKRMKVLVDDITSPFNSSINDEGSK